MRTLWNEGLPCYMELDPICVFFVMRMCVCVCIHICMIYVIVCTCMHSNIACRLGEACSHVAALLFYLEDCVQRRDKLLPDNSTCTDKLQQWHIPPKRTINPAPRKAEYGKVLEDRPKPTSYDPRHPSDQTLNLEHVGTLLDKLKTTCPTSGICQFGIFRESQHRLSLMMKRRL